MDLLVDDILTKIVTEYLFGDCRNDSGIAFARLALTSKSTQARIFPCVHELDFSFLSWYKFGVQSMITTPRYKMLDGATDNEKFQRQRWSLARGKFFVTRLTLFSNLKYLDLSGFPTPIASFKDLRLESLCLRFNYSWVSFSWLDTLLVPNSSIVESLRIVSLTVGHWENRPVEEIFLVFARRCRNLEELHINTTSYSVDINQKGFIKAMQELAEGCPKLKRLAVPSVVDWIPEWLPAFGRRLEKLGWFRLFYQHRADDLNPNLVAYIRFCIDQGLLLENIYFARKMKLGQFVLSNLLFLLANFCDKGKIYTFLDKVNLPKPERLDWNSYWDLGITPVLEVAECPTPELALEFLLSQDIDISHSRYDGANLLTLDLLRGHARIAHQIASVCKNDSEMQRKLAKANIFNSNLLISATAEYGSLSFVLANFPFLDVCTQDIFGYSALHYHVLYQNSYGISYLMRKGANVQLRAWTAMRDSPLSLALRYGCANRILKALVPNLHDYMSIMASKSPEALLMALLYGDRKSLRTFFLRGLGSPEFNPALQIFERANKIMPIYVAAMRGGSHMLRELLRSPRISSRINVNDTWRINHSGIQGGTPLHFAARWNKRESCQLLLKFGADAAALDYRNRTPLIIACAQRSGINCVTALLDATARKSSFNVAEQRSCYTALHWASSWSREDAQVLEQLLAMNGLDLMCRDADSRTALDWAKRHKYAGRQSPLLDVFMRAYSDQDISSDN